MFGLGMGCFSGYLQESLSGVFACEVLIRSDANLDLRESEDLALLRPVQWQVRKLAQRFCAESVWLTTL